jgi:hypothetical protein
MSFRMLSRNLAGRPWDWASDSEVSGVSEAARVHRARTA